MTKQWTVVRTYRNTATVVREGDEDLCRGRYLIIRQKLRAGSVSLIDPDGKVVARTEGGHNRSRW